MRPDPIEFTKEEANALLEVLIKTPVTVELGQVLSGNAGGEALKSAYKKLTEIAND